MFATGDGDCGGPERLFEERFEQVERLSELEHSLLEAGADVVGVDWRVPLSAGIERAGGRAVQGNLDPAVLFADRASIEAEVIRIVGEGRRAPGHVFNLGHGVLPETDPDVLTRVVDLVHKLSAR